MSTTPTQSKLRIDSRGQRLPHQNGPPRSRFRPSPPARGHAGAEPQEKGRRSNCGPKARRAAAVGAPHKDLQPEKPAGIKSITVWWIAAFTLLIVVAVGWGWNWGAGHEASPSPPNPALEAPAGPGPAPLEPPSTGGGPQGLRP